MNDIHNLENTLKKLKLTKRSFLLNGKDTEDIDIKIKEIQIKLQENSIEYKSTLK